MQKEGKLNSRVAQRAGRPWGRHRGSARRVRRNPWRSRWGTGARRKPRPL